MMRIISIEYDGPFSVTYSGRLAHRPDVDQIISVNQAACLIIIVLTVIVQIYIIKRSFANA